MHDIVYKKVGSEDSVQHPPVSAPFTMSETKDAPAQQPLETLIEAVNAAGAWLKETIDPSVEPAVVTPARSVPGAPLTEPTVQVGGKAEKQKVGRRKERKPSRIKESVKAAAEKAGRTGRRAHAALKTPTGKVAAVQTAAMLALFAYVAHGRPATVATVNLAKSEQGLSSQTTLRNYLPTTKDYSQPEAFSAAVPEETLPLHVWMTPWNLEQLQANGNAYGSVSAFWATLQSDGIGIEPKADWKVWDAYASANRKDGQKRYLTISADPDHSYLGLSDPDTQQKQIASLLQAVRDHSFDGIDIDYEGLGSENRNLFTEYVRALSETFHANGKSVAVTLEARIANQVPMDWHAVSDEADQVRIMVYDYHAGITSFPGPITPLGWLKEVLDYAAENIDSDKLVVGLGNYGRDWVKPEGSENWEGTGISFDQAMAIAKERNAPVIRAAGIDERGYDIGSIPMYVYQDEQGRQHSVWFEDKASLQAKLALISQYKTAGYILWSVGMGDPGIWQ